MQTIVTDKAKETSSAAVNLPHTPNDILKLRKRKSNTNNQKYIYTVNKRKIPYILLNSRARLLQPP